MVYYYTSTQPLGKVDVYPSTLLSQVHCEMLVLAGSTNETSGRLEVFLPASKAEFHVRSAKLQNELAELQAENAALNAEVASLKAETAADQALLNAVTLRVNTLTPVSFRLMQKVCP